MHAWRFEPDPKSNRKRHFTEPGFGHSLLMAVVSSVFKTLGISASLWEHDFEWFPLHWEANQFSFEVEHGKEAERVHYNDRCFAEVLRTKKTLLGEHLGFFDFFVPVLFKGKVAAILVVGSFLRASPTSIEIVERWRALTGRQGHPADPEFASYLTITLESLVLDGDKTRKLERLLGCLASLLAGEGKAGELANEAEALRAELVRSRFAQQMWVHAKSIIDDRSPRAWISVVSDADLKYFGLPRNADSVLVGLTVDRRPGTDPVDEAVRRAAFQRENVAFAREVGKTIAGRVGDHGVFFVTAPGGSAAAKRRKLGDLARRVARRAETGFGLALHGGASIASGSATLSRSYDEALGAAETALDRGEPLVFAEPETARSGRSLRALRRDLARNVEERARTLRARFDRYLDVVASSNGHRLEPCRGHLEAALERLIDPLLASGALDERSLDELNRTLDRAANDARTTRELFVVYRRAVDDVVDAVTRPVPARRDRSLRAALDYVHQHYSEPLRIGKVARLAGFTPDHFGKLFKERETMTFERYVRGMRMERAKQLLANTDLAVQRVADLSGFGAYEHFSRTFRRETGQTALAFREQALEKTVLAKRKKS